MAARSSGWRILSSASSAHRSSPALPGVWYCGSGSGDGCGRVLRTSTRTIGTGGAGNGWGKWYLRAEASYPTRAPFTSGPGDDLGHRRAEAERVHRVVRQLQLVVQVWTGGAASVA